VNYEEEKKRYVSFCGSYCHTCDWFTGRIKKTFQSSLAMLEQYGFRKLLEGEVDYENLKLGLQILANSGIDPGCKADVAENPEEDRCRIRQCCVGRGLDLCSECTHFPCELLRTNPGVMKFHCIDNLNEIKEKGIRYWIDKQWQDYLGSSQG
jgi:hypothetical protein